VEAETSTNFVLTFGLARRVTTTRSCTTTRFSRTGGMIVAGETGCDGAVPSVNSVTGGDSRAARQK
jgi:hypothetical protein